MIKKLRKKFIAVSMISVFIVLTLLMGIINFMNYREVITDADETISMIEENGGTMPGPMGSMANRSKDGTVSEDNKSDEGKAEPPEKPDGEESGSAGYASKSGNSRPEAGKAIRGHKRAEMFFDTRYFTVTFDSEGKVSSSNTERIAAIDEDQAETIAESIYKGGRSKGFSGNYRYLVTDVENDSDDSDNSDKSNETGSTMVICVDCYRGLGNFRSFLLYSVLVSLAGLVLVFLLVLVLSGKVVKPVAESYEKQKQFITDAGHELKTPLTVIDADISVMEMEGTKSEWTDDIKLQTKRLAGLTNELVYLSRMDEGRKVERMEFPLSDVASEEVQSFAARAKVEGKTLDSDIESNVAYAGDQKMIKELISILLDNAIKYSDEEGKIDFVLKKNGSSAEIVCSNSVDTVTQEQADRMFDRFYRADASRSEKSGYGLGLSIAKAVCEAHQGSIRADAAPDGKKIMITARLG